MRNSIKNAPKRSIWADGEPFIWATAGALGITLLSVVILILVIIYNGMGVFWPHRLTELLLRDGSKALGHVLRWEEQPSSSGRRVQIKLANRDLYPADFRWLNEEDIQSTSQPSEAIVLERQEYGDFIGYLASVNPSSTPVDASQHPLRQMDAAWREASSHKAALHESETRIQTLANAMERIRLKQASITYQLEHQDTSPSRVNSLRDAHTALDSQYNQMRLEFDAIVTSQQQALAAIRQNTATFLDAGGREKTIPLIDIVRWYAPNQMSISSRVGFYLGKLWELVSTEPRESNTEGGLFPAIFGTIMLIFLMSLLSFPLGVLAAVYLCEYAHEGILVRCVHIAVNNLAGIPSIVYGIFGLGFFVYGVGGSIDRIFFPERLPTPTFGTGGILWASLTLGILTVPVVIVATEEALRAVPKGMRDAAYALGSTRLQMLTRIVIPMALPGIMTGFILAMARAAGEVAPLMITGVVKLAPSLMLDSTFPYIHPERKFMHLGFHIYDIGFQSPNVEAAKPMVFVTTLLLVLIVLIMSSLAIYLRNRMRKRYALGSL